LAFGGVSAYFAKRIWAFGDLCNLRSQPTYVRETPSLNSSILHLRRPPMPLAHRQLNQNVEGKRLSGNRGILRREKKTNFAFRFLNFNQKLIMAKTLRLNEFAPLTHTSNSQAGSFWEHWFDAHAATPAPQLEQHLDEHSIWEKAVSLEVLTAKGKGY